MQFIAFFVPIFFTVFIGGGYMYKQMQESDLSQEATVIEDVSPRVQIVEPTDPTLVTEKPTVLSAETQQTQEPKTISAPSPQPVAVKVQPKEEKKKKDNFDKELREISEMLNQPSKLSEKSDLPKLEPTTISKPSTYKSPDFHVDIKSPTTSSGSKLTGAECGGSAGKYLPHCPK